VKWGIWIETSTITTMTILTRNNLS